MNNEVTTITTTNPKGSGRKKGFKFESTPTEPDEIKKRKIEIMRKTYAKRGGFISSIKLRLDKYPNDLRADNHKVMTDTELYDYFIRIKTEYDRLVLNDRISNLGKIL